jgi:hypothetical protein
LKVNAGVVGDGISLGELGILITPRVSIGVVRVLLEVLPLCFLGLQRDWLKVETESESRYMSGVEWDGCTSQMVTEISGFAVVGRCSVGSPVQFKSSSSYKLLAIHSSSTKNIC